MSQFVLHSPLRAWKPGDYPLAPFVHFAAGEPGAVDYQLLSTQLMTDREVDEAAERLGVHPGLALEAKRELAELQAKMLKRPLAPSHLAAAPH